MQEFNLLLFSVGVTDEMLVALEHLKASTEFVSELSNHELGIGAPLCHDLAHLFFVNLFFCQLHKFRTFLRLRGLWEKVISFHDRGQGWWGYRDDLVILNLVDKLLVLFRDELVSGDLDLIQILSGFFLIFKVSVRVVEHNPLTVQNSVCELVNESLIANKLAHSFINMRQI